MRFVKRLMRFLEVERHDPYGGVILPTDTGGILFPGAPASPDPLDAAQEG